MHTAPRRTKRTRHHDRLATLLRVTSWHAANESSDPFAELAADPAGLDHLAARADDARRYQMAAETHLPEPPVVPALEGAARAQRYRLPDDGPGVAWDPAGVTLPVPRYFPCGMQDPGCVHPECQLGVLGAL